MIFHKEALCLQKFKVAVRIYQSLNGLSPPCVLFLPGDLFRQRVSL